MINPEIFLVTIFIGFFAMINPFGNLLNFQKQVRGKSTADIQQIALKAVVLAFIIVTIVTLFGTYFFQFLSLTIGAFRIAGGLYLATLGFGLMNGKSLKSHRPLESNRDGRLENSLSFSPIATPIIAGPGTIMLAINFSTLHQGPLHTLVILVGLALNCIICYFLFVAANTILQKFSLDAIDMVSRIMGIIITVMGVQMVISGIRESIKLMGI